jgi:putative peptidoglycan lipid II flippase
MRSSHPVGGPSGPSGSSAESPGNPSAESPATESPATESPADDAPPAASVVRGGSASVARSSAVLAVATLVSRVTGFLRTAAIVAAIGLGPVSNAYTVSIQLPNAVYELLLGGILSSVIVPLLVKAQAEPDGGKAYTDRLLSVALVLFGAVTALAVLAAPLITRVYLGDDLSIAGLTTALGRLSLLTIAFLGVSALLGAVLNARERFVATGWGPVANNVVVIAIAAALMIVTSRSGLSVSTFGGLPLLLLGLTFPIGVAVQAGVLWVALRRSGYRWRWRFDLRGVGLGEIGRLARWTLLYVAVNQLAVFALVRVLAMNDERGGPGNAVHQNAFVLFMLPHGIAAVSVITALLPRMSRTATAGDLRGVASQLGLGVRLSSVVMIPATAAFLALGPVIATVVYGHGKAEPDLVRAIGWATMAAGIGLVPFAWSQLQIFAFYALRDTRTPALLNIGAIAVRIGAIGLAYVLLPPSLTVVGTMTANTLSYLVALVLTGVVLRRRLGPLGTTMLLRTLTRLALVGLVAGAAAWAVSWAAQAGLGSGTTGSLVAVLAGGSVLVVLFVIGAFALRVREVTDVVGILRRKLT